MLPMMAGARPLVGSSISSSLRGSTMARAIDSICFCPPDSTPAASDQNFSSAGNRPKIQSRRGLIEVPAARRQDEVLAYREIGEYTHVLRHIGDTGSGDVGRGASADLLAVERAPCRLRRATAP